MSPLYPLETLRSLCCVDLSGKVNHNGYAWLGVQFDVQSAAALKFLREGKVPLWLL